MPQLPLPAAAPHVKKFLMPSTAKQPDGTPTPEDQQAWVKMDVGPITPTDSQQFSDEDRNAVVRLQRIVVGRIKEWNFVNADGQPEPINLETYYRLAQEDKEYLQSIEFDGGPPPLTDDQKKTSTSTSTPS